MSITQAVCRSFIAECFTATHNVATDTIKCALYTSAVILSADTAVYAATNEFSGTGYSAGGTTVTGGAAALTNGIPTITFDNIVFASIVVPTSGNGVRGALLYNSSKSNKAVCVIDFGSDLFCTLGLTIHMPTVTSTTAFIHGV